MKFFHLADLHLGRKLLGESLIEEQRYILEEIMKNVRVEKPDGIFICGDIYDKYIPLVAIASPILCYILQRNSEAWFNGYQISYELLLFNAAFTFIGLCFLIRKKSTMDNTTVL